MSIFLHEKIEQLRGKYGENIICDTPEKVSRIINQCIQKKVFCLDVESTGFNPRTDKLLGISLVHEPGQGFYINLNAKQGVAVKLEHIQQMFIDLFTNQEVTVVGHNIKFDLSFLLNKLKILPACNLADTMIIDQILKGGKYPQGLEVLVKDAFGYDMVSIEELMKDKYELADIDLMAIALYSVEDADYTLQLYHYLINQPESMKLEKVIQLEMQVLPVVVAMEYVGIAVDTKQLELSSESFFTTSQEKVFSITKQFNEVGKREVNLDSPAQLGEALIACGVPLTERTEKTNQVKVTDAILAEFSNYKIVNEVVEYRTTRKHANIITSQFIHNTEKGRIHPSYLQIGAETGRFSCREPNLQNISKEPMIRDSFITHEQGKLISVDYSQIELRVLAHCSQDTKLIQAFNEGRDLHEETANALGITRKEAKAISFGISYSMGAATLSTRLGITEAKAVQYIDDWYKVYEGVRTYRTACIDRVLRDGYISTLSGRKRYLVGTPEYPISTRALNTVIQGSAADILKAALVKTYSAIKGKGARIVLNVHDEIVVESRTEEVDSIVPLIHKAMVSVYPLLVPLVVDISIGDKWGSLQPYNKEVV